MVHQDGDTSTLYMYIVYGNYHGKMMQVWWVYNKLMLSNLRYHLCLYVPHTTLQSNDISVNQYAGHDLRWKTVRWKTVLHVRTYKMLAHMKPCWYQTRSSNWHRTQACWRGEKAWYLLFVQELNFPHSGNPWLDFNYVIPVVCTRLSQVQGCHKVVTMLVTLLQYNLAARWPFYNLAARL